MRRFLNFEDCFRDHQYKAWRLAIIIITNGGKSGTRVRLQFSLPGLRGNPCTELRKAFDQTNCSSARFSRMHRSGSAFLVLIGVNITPIGR